MKALIRNRFFQIGFFVLAFQFSVSAQSRFGIKAGVGISRIAQSMENFDATFDNPLKLSVLGGFFYHYPLSAKSSIGAELLISQLNGTEKNEHILYSLNDDGTRNYRGSQKDIVARYLSGIAVPLTYRFNVGKIGFYGGMQFIYIFRTLGKETIHAVVDGQEYNDRSRTTDINMERFNYGPCAGITFRLSNRLALEGTYYYGLNNLQKGDPVLEKLKTQQATLGVQYFLKSKRGR